MRRSDAAERVYAMNKVKAIAAMLLGGAFIAPAYAADPTSGAQLYARHCVTCHGDRGRPMMPGLPDFARGERLMQSDANLVGAIKNGRGLMPAYRGLLTDDEILDVIAHLRLMRR